MANPPIVLVTGAGSGIGRELARLFLNDGSRVIAVSLLQDELDTLAAETEASDRLTTLQMDLSQPDATQRLLDYCDGHHLEVETLVNNAGFACFGPAINLDPARVANMIAVNITALTTLSMVFGARMKLRGQGKILNVGSATGLVPSQSFASYGASKAYVNLFSTTLGAELEPYGVSVTCLIIGSVNTNFKHAAVVDSDDSRSRLTGLFASSRVMTAQQVARAGYMALQQSKGRVLVGLEARFAVFLTSLVPPGILARLVKL
jgi:uncharacterized protein